MKKLKSAGIAVALSSAMFALPASANVTLDLFSDDGQSDQEVIVDVTGGTAVSSVADFVPTDPGGIDVLGFERDIFIEKLTGGNGLDASLKIAGGIMSYSNESTVASIATVQWDGVDGLAGKGTDNLQVTGLGGIDFSLFAGFQLDVIQSDAGFLFEVGMFDIFGGSSTVQLTANAVSSPETQFISKNVFDQTLFDETAIGAIVLTINPLEDTTFASQNIDFSISAVSAVPVHEPGSLGLMGLALLGLGLGYRKKRLSA